MHSGAPGRSSSEDTPAVDYSAVAAALSHSVSSAADAGQKLQFK